MTTAKYNLFAAKTNPETMKAAMEEKYGRITPTYVLIYREGDESPAGFKQMGENELRFLTKRDLEWLTDTNIAVMEAFVKAHREEEERAMLKFMEEFRANLEAEQKKIREEWDHGDRE